MEEKQKQELGHQLKVELFNDEAVDLSQTFKTFKSSKVEFVLKSKSEDLEVS